MSVSDSEVFSTTFDLDKKTFDITLKLSIIPCIDISCKIDTRFGLFPFENETVYWDSRAFQSQIHCFNMS